MARGETFLLRHVRNGKVANNLLLSRDLFERLWTMAHKPGTTSVNGTRGETVRTLEKDEATGEYVDRPVSSKSEPSSIIGRTAEDKGGQMKVCPKCGKLFKSGGLAGHLFYTHGIKDQELKELFSSAETDQFSRAEEVLNLMKKFQRIKEQRKELERLEGTMPEKAMAELSTSIDRAQDYILKSLEEKGVFLTDEEDADAANRFKVRSNKSRRSSRPSRSEQSDEITDAFIQDWESKHIRLIGFSGIDLRKERKAGWTRALPGHEFDPARFKYEEHDGEWFKLLRTDAPPLPPDPEQITDEQIHLSKTMVRRETGDIKYLQALRDQGYLNILPREEPDTDEFEITTLEGKKYKRPHEANS